MKIASKFFRHAPVSRATQRARRATKLSLETLDGRVLLSLLTVKSAADSGPDTLRYAVDNAVAGDVIRFDPTLFGQVIKLTSGEIDVKVNLTIQGPGSDKVKIWADFKSSIFGIGAGASFTVSGLTLQNGTGLRGGAIHNDSAGQLNVMKCVFFNNEVFGQIGNPNPAEGGAIASRGPLYVNGCNFDADSAGSFEGQGGAIYCDGPILNVTESYFIECYAYDGGALAWAPSVVGSAGAAPTSVITFDRFLIDNVQGNLYSAAPSGAPVGGGAVNVSAGSTTHLQLTMAHCTFHQDFAKGGLAQGGSVRLDASHSFSPSFLLFDNTYNGGSAQGGVGPILGWEALGGAVAALAEGATSPTFTIYNDVIRDTTAQGGSNSQPQPGHGLVEGGDAAGGGIYLDAGYSLGARFFVRYTAMSNDQAIGGSGGSAPSDPNSGVPAAGGAGGNGGGLYAFADHSSSASFTLRANGYAQCTASGGEGGQGSGASASTPAFPGGYGGYGSGGGVVFDAGTAFSAAFSEYGSYYYHDMAQGGTGGTGGGGGSFYDAAAGGGGGKAFGGSLEVYQPLGPNGGAAPFSATVKLCEFVGDQARGGTGGAGGQGFSGGTGGAGGEARGGGIMVDAPTADRADVLTFDGDTLQGDQARGGTGGSGGQGIADGGSGGIGGDSYGGGILTYFAGIVELLNPVIASCTASDEAGGSGGAGSGGKGNPGNPGMGHGGGIAAYSYQVGGIDSATAQRFISDNTAAVSPDIDGNLGTI
jgi:hypothetical protein